MFKKKLTDTQILNALQQGGQRADKMLMEVYRKNKPVVFGYLLKHGAAESEAKDIYQDAMIAFFENIHTGKFRGESAIGSYIFSIARFTWLNRLKRKKMEAKAFVVAQSDHVEKSHLLKMLEEEKRNQVLILFNGLGKSCREILMNSIYFNYSMKEIAREMKYKNEQVARNKKSRCLKNLKMMVAKQPEIIAFLKN